VLWLGFSIFAPQWPKVGEAEIGIHYTIFFPLKYVAATKA
jgi:hypothetical protein